MAWTEGNSVLCFAAKLRQHLAPGFSLGWEAKTRSISRETATAMVFFNDINTLLSPFHGLTFIFKLLPQAKAWGYLLPPLRGEIRTKAVPRVVQKPMDHRGRPQWRMEVVIRSGSCIYDLPNHMTMHISQPASDPVVVIG